MKPVRPGIKIGYRVGMLTVESKTDERKNGYTIWLCKCDCGGEIRLDTRCLQRRTVTDCGCISVVKPGMLDLTGQRFGKLVCLRPYEGISVEIRSGYVSATAGIPVLLHSISCVPDIRKAAGA